METVEKEKDYSSACSKFFSCKHNWYPQLAQGVYHPNQYYAESRKAFKMSALTPPDSGQVIGSEQQPNDVSMTADTTADTFDESMFETEDEFDRSIAGIHIECEPNSAIVSKISQQTDQ